MSPQNETVIGARSEADIVGRFLDAAASTVALRVGSEGEIVSANAALARRVGMPVGEIPGRTVRRVLTDADGRRIESWLNGSAPPDDPVLLNFIAPPDTPFTLKCVVGMDRDQLLILGEPETGESVSVTEELMRLNNELSTLARERTRRQRELDRTRRELEAALEELRTSYWHLQKIQEVLPICMHCGKVRTTAMEWQSVIDYLKANDILMSHGYCPDCADDVLREAGLEGDDS